MVGHEAVRNYGEVLVGQQVAIGIVNVWAALHYLLGSRSLRQDLEATEKLATA